MVLLFPDGKKFIHTLQTNGTFIEKPRGERSFGFDQFFIPDDDKKGRTLSEISLEDKNHFSPRYKAFTAIISQLK